MAPFRYAEPPSRDRVSDRFNNALSPCWLLHEGRISRSLLRSREGHVYPLPPFDKQQRRLCSRCIDRCHIHYILLGIVVLHTSCLLNLLGKDLLKLETLRITLTAHQ